MDTQLQAEHAHSALITIDVQRDTLDGQPCEIPGTSAVLPRLQRLLVFFRTNSRPIIHIVRLYKSDGSNVDLCRRRIVAEGAHLFLAGSSGSQLAMSILPSPEITLDAERLLAGGVQQIGAQEWIIYKPRWGAFFQTPLQTQLAKREITTLVFTGCNFPNCPRTSIYEASERDFRLVAIEDAISRLDARGKSELENIGVMVLDTEGYLNVAAQPAVPADMTAGRERVAELRD